MGTPEKIINRKYVSKKIKTVRWKPSQLLCDQNSLFVTGSWDDEVNSLCVWRISKSDCEPEIIQEVVQNSDINDIQYITRDILASGNGDGTIKVFEHEKNGLVTCKKVWNHSHKLPSGLAACTCLAVNNEQIVSVGEDGIILVHSPKVDKPVIAIDTDSDCSYYAVVFVAASQILTGNMQGHLKLWDLRTKAKAKQTLISPDQVSVNYLSSHPSQQHLIAAGGDDGSLALWDMRQASQPFALISAHVGPISEVHFHPSASDHLFTCGYDGKILDWNASSQTGIDHVMDTSHTADKSKQNNAWFSEDVKQGYLDAVNIVPPSRLPINSLNIESETLLAGTDNECVYIVDNVFYE